MGFKKIKLSHISLKSLEMDHLYEYTIYYLKDVEQEVYAVLIKSGDKFTVDTQKFIDENTIKDVFVKFEDHEKYEKDTQKYLEKILQKDDVDVELKTAIMHEMAADVVNDLLEGEVTSQKIEQAADLINDTVSLITENPNAIEAMLSVTSHDYYTYTHCVNVSTYALGFGKFLGLDDEKLKLLGMAGIMHDLGKRRVPSEIINKNGKLTDEEFDIMKSHPIHGADILSEMGETNQLLLNIVEQHHEKLNGGGYPYKLKGGNIDPLSQIMAIADIYDALTTKRSYKDALSADEAFEIMKKYMEHELNPVLLGKFIKFIHQ